MKKIHVTLLEISAIVLFIAILATLGIFKYNEVFNHFPRYTVEFADIDGLEVGAPVRLAGVHAGHVTKQELKNNKILITFKITDRDIKIPRGSVADIEFTGLAGSKSLEIKPFKAKTDRSVFLHPIEPLRVGSLMEVQSIISEATLEFFEGILAFLDEHGNKAKNNLRQTADVIGEKAIMLEDMGKNIETQREDAVKRAEDLKNLASEAEKNIAYLNKTVTDLTENKAMQENFRKIKKSARDLSKIAENGKIEEIGEKVEGLNHKLEKIKDKELAYIEEFNENLKSASKKIQELIKELQKEQE